MTIDEALETLKYTRAGLYCAVDGNPTVYADALEMAIKALEQTRWIPISERLPKGKQPILISLSWDNDIPEVRQGNIDDINYWKHYSHITSIAWMPLPQPYREIQHTCSECIIKDTDACARGNAEADEVACEDFVGGDTDAE